MAPQRRSEYTYRPAWWVPGGHAQTLWGKLLGRRPSLPGRLVRWETPDGDFIDVHRFGGPVGAPRLLLLHGLEGTVHSHYVSGFFNEAQRRGWSADLLVFRGCGTELNHARRFYHSGETSDLAFVLDRIEDETCDAPIVLAGVSLGGNVLLKFLGERGAALSSRIRAAVAISVPFDLERCARHISAGFSRIYDRHFVRSLRRKALAKLERYPDLCHQSAVEQAGSLYEFDDTVTAPLHGFVDAHDYYSRSSSLGFLDSIRTPTLLLSAADDPFLPRDVLDRVKDVAANNPYLRPEFHEHGGHVGFVGGRVPWRPFYYGDWRACDFLSAAL